nr:3404_t:CDS:2 [Entrophospora candida]
MSNKQRSELQHQQQFQQYLLRHQQLLKIQERHRQESQELQRKQDLEFLLFLNPSRKNISNACIRCRKSHLKCKIEESSASCDWCTEKEFECTFTKPTKRGRKPKENSDNRNGHQCCYSSSEPLANVHDLHKGSQCFLSSAKRQFIKSNDARKELIKKLNDEGIGVDGNNNDTSTSGLYNIVGNNILISSSFQSTLSTYSHSSISSHDTYDI